MFFLLKTASPINLLRGAKITKKNINWQDFIVY